MPQKEIVPKGNDHLSLIYLIRLYTPYFNVHNTHRVGFMHAQQRVWSCAKGPGKGRMILDVNAIS